MGQPAQLLDGDAVVVGIVCAVFAAGASVVGLYEVLEHLPTPPAPAEEPAAESGPWTPTGEPEDIDGDAPEGWTCERQDWGLHCTKPPPPVPPPSDDSPLQLPSTDGTWGHGMPRTYRECDSDYECPVSAPKCGSDDHRCHECSSHSDCPGGDNYCRNGRCRIEEH